MYLRMLHIYICTCMYGTCIHMYMLLVHVYTCVHAACTHLGAAYTHVLAACTTLASYPGSRGGGGKREPGTDRLRMRLINSKFCRL